MIADSAVFRRTMRGLLAGCPDLEVVGEATDGNEAVAMAANLHPAVVLMDVHFGRVISLRVMHPLMDDVSKPQLRVIPV